MQASTPIELTAPGSKSIAHRLLIGAALAEGVSELAGISLNRDIEQTAEILRTVGAKIQFYELGRCTVAGVGRRLLGGKTAAVAQDCYVGESGTTCRLLTAVLATGSGFFHLHGSPRMEQRPLAGLLHALESLGAHLQFLGMEYSLPFILNARGLRNPPDGGVRVSMLESSQYLSGLLLAAPLAETSVRPFIIEPHGSEVKGAEINGSGLAQSGGSHVISWPYVQLTLQAMADFGVCVQVETRLDLQSPWSTADWRNLKFAQCGLLRFVIHPGAYRAGEYRVEGDWSGASYLLAGGIVGSREVGVAGLQKDSLQGDRAILDILDQMGGRTFWRDGVIFACPSQLRGVEVDLGACPDLAPTIAVLAAFAKGRTRIFGAAHLRHKESDRIAALVCELCKVGVQASELPDGLLIEGQGGLNLTGRRLERCAFGDHRLAMSWALLELAGAKIILDDPAVVAKSFPNFWVAWQQITGIGLFA